MTQEIIEIDKQMTELKRVMDAPPEQYTSMLQDVISLSQELGNNVHDVLGSLNEAARSFGDMSQQELLDITKTATVAANVSDLKADDAMKDLIGTMNAFHVSVDKSMDLVDKMNETDNRFSISTVQIADALSKASSTAATFGVNIDDLIGHITAIGSVTMESGSIIGNSLKTIYSRITTMDDASDFLKSIGISVKDMSGDMRPVEDILSDLAKNWNSLTDAQRQNGAVALAGRQQLSR